MTATRPPRANSFKAAILAGQQQIGLWQALASPVALEICAGAGFDWLLIDAEHGPNNVPSVLPQLQAAAAYEVEPVVRLPAGDVVLVKQYLDIGARTLLIPMVETAAQAEHLVRATRYPPRGFRGVGAAIVRASRWGRHTDYLQVAEMEICLLLQVETVAGLEALDAIAAVPGVDGVFIGPADLAASLGHLGRADAPEVQSAIDRALARLRSHGRAAGILAADEALARRYLQAGASFVAIGSDVAILARGAEALATRHR
jgi:4-hydroxy-2-oxoheptanedioate aldolase